MPSDHVPLRALIWDVDGTLAETERDGHLPAFNEAFAAAGLPWHWDEATYADLLRIAGGKERMLHWWQRVDPAAAAATEALPRITALHAAKTIAYTRRVAAGAVALRPGVERLLRQARAAGLRQAIATTTQLENVQALLLHTIGEEALGWFDIIGAGDVVPRKKPAPDIYHWVLAGLGLPAAEVLVIEDSAVGVAAARSAGLAVLAVRSAFSLHDALPGAAAQLLSLDGAAGTLAALRALHSRPHSQETS